MLSFMANSQQGRSGILALLVDLLEDTGKHHCIQDFALWAEWGTLLKVISKSPLPPRLMGNCQMAIGFRGTIAGPDGLESRPGLARERSNSGLFEYMMIQSGGEIS